MSNAILKTEDELFGDYFEGFLDGVETSNEMCKSLRETIENTAMYAEDILSHACGYKWQAMLAINRREIEICNLYYENNQLNALCMNKRRKTFQEIINID